VYVEGSQQTADDEYEDKDEESDEAQLALPSPSYPQEVEAGQQRVPLAPMHVSSGQLFEADDEGGITQLGFPYISTSHNSAAEQQILPSPPTHGTSQVDADDWQEGSVTTQLMHEQPLQTPAPQGH
jgi:hypothetical protein